MDKLGEIISRVERRRKWTAEQKVKILTEVLKPGTTRPRHGPYWPGWRARQPVAPPRPSGTTGVRPRRQPRS